MSRAVCGVVVAFVQRSRFVSASGASGPVGRPPMLRPVEDRTECVRGLRNTLGRSFSLTIVA
eukprot:6602078-Alexandrium_andersonii.AAC.1